MKTLTLTALGSVLAMAAAGPTLGATSVKLENMAARVVVIPENRTDVDLRVRYNGADLPVIMVRTNGDTFVADGKLRERSLSCRDNGDVYITGKGVIPASKLPVITVRVPLDAEVGVEGATTGEVQASRRLDFTQGGCGTWTIGDVAGEAELSVGGSGDLTAGRMGDAEINIGGSGSLNATTATRLRANIGGNGDITFEAVDGPIEINIGGSGDVSVTGGRSDDVEVNIAGSGDVRLGGEVRNLEVNIVGSGDVRVRKVTGNVSKSIMGSGNIQIGQ